MQTDALVFLVFRNSAMMVLVGGAATTAVLFVVAFASVWFRNKELPASLKPSPLCAILLTLSILAILAVGVNALVAALR